MDNTTKCKYIDLTNKNDLKKELRNMVTSGQGETIFPLGSKNKPLDAVSYKVTRNNITLLSQELNFCCTEVHKKKLKKNRIYGTCIIRKISQMIIILMCGVLLWGM